MSTKLKSTSQLGGLLGAKLKVNQVNGSTVVTNSPKRKMVGDPSAKQVAAKEKFIAATNYAKYQKATPALLEIYKTGINAEKRTAYVVALTDFLNAPKVRSINTSTYEGNIDDGIVVTAVDDFKVIGVKVKITGADGKVLEKGDAIQGNARPAEWTYKCTTTNPSVPGSRITAVAVDMPGNEATLDIAL